MISIRGAWWRIGIIYFAMISSASAITSSEMKEAMGRHMCPADATEVSFLNYDTCGPQPTGASSSYLRCQNTVDGENNTISAYNEFVRACNRTKAGSTTSSDLNRRLNSQQSITKQSEEQRTKEQYQQQIQNEEKQEAKKKQDEDLAEQRRQLDVDLAKQRANQAAEKAKADKERQPSIVPAEVPPPPKIALERYGLPSGTGLYDLLKRNSPNCMKSNGLNVCSFQRAPNPRLLGKCYDAHIAADGNHLNDQKCVTNSGQWTSVRDEERSNFSLCVDVVCFGDN
jgi:hypothetical protein